jgi:hypothetical protein
MTALGGGKSEALDGKVFSPTPLAIIRKRLVGKAPFAPAQGCRPVRDGPLGSRHSRGNTTAVIFNAILSRAPAPLLRLNPETPPKLEEIINRLLEKDRGLRPRNAP